MINENISYIVVFLENLQKNKLYNINLKEELNINKIKDIIQTEVENSFSNLENINKEKIKNLCFNFITINSEDIKENDKKQDIIIEFSKILD